MISIPHGIDIIAFLLTRKNQILNMPTIHDVARLAGVASITASRVVNQSGYYSEEIRERVEKAVAELGYVPNIIARSLRSKRTHTLALVVTDIANPFFTLVARGVEDAASEAGFTIFYCNSDESEGKETKYLGLLLQKQVDGILLVPARSHSKSVAFLKEQNTPVVVIDRRVNDAQTDTVRCDSEGGAYQLTHLLVGQGHRCIAMLTGPEDVSTAVDRVAGYQRAMLEAGLPDEGLVFRGEFNQGSGYEMAEKALALSPRPTALFAANNFIAIGALKALRAAKLRVPDDISIVAFDDLPDTMLVEPILTVAAQPAYEMGHRAAQLLLARLNNDAQPECQEIVLPTKIIVRQSSAAPSGI
jgi:LacI family transcriptional regulator